MKAAKYFALNGTKKTEVEADGIILQTPEGEEIELHFRQTDQKVSLSCRGGSSLCILPH